MHPSASTTCVRYSTGSDGWFAPALHGATCPTICHGVGGGAGFRMGIAISEVGERLREAARHFGGVALRRLHLPLPPAGVRHSKRGFITRSSEASPCGRVPCRARAILRRPRG